MTRSPVTWAVVIGAVVVTAAKSIGWARRHQRARPSAAWRALEAADLAGELPRYDEDDTAALWRWVQPVVIEAPSAPSQPRVVP